jgi:hypothetical protein
VTTTDQLRQLTDQSRVRLAAVEDLRAQCQLLARHSRRRLDESRRILDRWVPPGEV